MLIPARAIWLPAAVLAVIGQLVKSGDWQHLLWTTMLSMLGLLATSGAMLVVGRGRAVLVALATLTVMPLAAITALGGLDDFEVTAVDSVPIAIGEVLTYGFTGDIPECMEPRPESRAAQAGDALGSPSRDVTVPMGAIYFGSLAITLVGLILIISKAIPQGALRAIWLYVSPLSVFVLLKLPGGLRGAEVPIWRNHPDLVAAVGPLTAAAAAAFLIGMVVADRPKAKPEAPAQTLAPNNA